MFKLISSIFKCLFFTKKNIVKLNNVTYDKSKYKCFCKKCIKIREYNRKYNMSERGRARKRRYENSEKGIATRLRYKYNKANFNKV